MPEVSRFYGIIIRFYYRDHPPTHFHAIYGEHEGLVEIETGQLHQGYLPAKAMDLVNQWRLLHLEELATARFSLVRLIALSAFVPVKRMVKLSRFYLSNY